MNVPADMGRRPRSSRALVLVGIAAVLLAALLIGLGVWQLERLQWKLQLTAEVDARIHARDASGRPALWQVGANSLGFSGHPGLKVAMVEDLVMEFDESPPAFEKTLVRLRAIQRRLEDALVPIMTGVIGVTGWMD